MYIQREQLFLSISLDIYYIKHHSLQIYSHVYGRSWVGISYYYNFLQRVSPYSYTLHLRPLTFTSTMPTLTTTDPPEDELDEKPDFNPVVSGLYSTPRGS